jgi:uncharacterized protein (DUF2141 family)
MALYQWHASASQTCLLTLFVDRLAELNMVVVPSVSNSEQVYAVCSPAAEMYRCSNVKLVAAWTDLRAGEFQIDLISDEPLLLSGSSCEQLFLALQKIFLPI